MESEGAWLKQHLRDIPDFPSAGVVFKDITPLLGHASAFATCVAALADAFVNERVDKVVGIEARGFIVAAPVAVRLGAGFVPLRKPGRLPWKVQAEQYALEYGQDSLEIHSDALLEGERVLIIDDVLATGGTASAAVRLVEALGAVPVGLGCILELSFLHGRGKLGGLRTVSLLRDE